jgi:hypothetical protein
MRPSGGGMVSLSHLDQSAGHRAKSPAESVQTAKFKESISNYGYNTATGIWPLRRCIRSSVDSISENDTALLQEPRGAGARGLFHENFVLAETRSAGQLAVNYLIRPSSLFPRLKSSICVPSTYSVLKERPRRWGFFRNRVTLSGRRRTLVLSGF